MKRELWSSCRTDEWATPQAVFDKINADYGPFDLDPCATQENAKCARFYTREQDGLKQPWIGRVFCNPPYGRQIPLWMKKAKESADAGAYVVCLIPVKTDTRWWHDYVERIAHVEFIKGRIKFGNSKNSAPFPSCLAIYTGDY